MTNPSATWSLAIGHWALGIGHFRLGARRPAARVSKGYSTLASAAGERAAVFRDVENVACNGERRVVCHGCPSRGGPSRFRECDGPSHGQDGRGTREGAPVTSCVDLFS